MFIRYGIGLSSLAGTEKKGRWLGKQKKGRWGLFTKFLKFRSCDVTVCGMLNFDLSLVKSRCQLICLLEYCFELMTHWNNAVRYCDIW